MSSCFFSSRLKTRISLISVARKRLQDGVAEGAGAAGDEEGLVFKHASGSFGRLPYRASPTHVRLPQMPLGAVEGRTLDLAAMLGQHGVQPLQVLPAFSAMRDPQEERMERQ